MTNEKVSVILTAYNSNPEWLRQSIESVTRQSYDNWELIIMEDNSDEGHPMYDVLKEYNHHKIKIVYSDISPEDRYKTARYATLINEGVRGYSTGELLSYLTDDDYFYSYKLKDMVAHYHDQSSFLDRFAIYGAQHIVDTDGHVAGYRSTQGVLDNAWNKVDHSSVIHSRETFDLAGGWDDDPGCWGGADSYFWRRLSEAGVIFFPMPTDMPNEAKRYHTNSVQWKMANESFFPEGDTDA